MDIRRSENGVLGTFGEGIFESGGRNGVTDPWGVESTHESKDSTKESRKCHQGVQWALHGLFFREERNEWWRGKFHPGRVKNAETGHSNF
jgi:hypothetical protein